MRPLRGGPVAKIAAELRELHEASASGREVGPAGWLLLRAVGAVAQAARWVKHTLYRMRVLPRTHVPALTISVGNVTTGGSGKTPLAAWIAEVLAGEEARVVLLSRGYGRDPGPWAVWASKDGKVLATPRTVGDEAWLLARTVPQADVLVGKRRAATAKLAWRERAPDAVVLDDGFQYWRLTRDLDVVTLDLPLEPARLRPFPVGVLREPLERLGAADLVVLTGAVGDERALAEARALLARVAPSVPWMKARYVATGLREAGRQAGFSLEAAKGRRAVALTAIGRPGGFVRALEDLGCEAVLAAPYPDHHRFTRHELEHETRRARAWGADLIVMTAKDEANLPAGYRFTMQALVLETEFAVENGDGPALYDMLRGRLAHRRPGMG